jgi:phage shock protein C
MENLILMPFIIGIMVFAGLAALAFWIWSIIDCIQSKSNAEYKIIWLLIIIFLNIIGSILYFIFSNQKNSNFSFNQEKGKRLMKSNEDKMLSGVCGGIAEYFNIDSAIVRIVWVLLTLFVINFTGVIIYIVFAIAMPLNKKTKENSNSNKKNKNKKTKKADNKTELHIPNKKNKSPLVILLIVLLSIFVITSIVVSGFVAYTFVAKTEQGFSIDDVSIKINLNELSEKDIAKDIMESYNYKEYNGYDLRLIAINQPEKEKCTLLQRDPYGLRIYDSGCKEYHHRFFVNDSEIIKGFEVKNIVIRNQIVETEIIEIPKKKESKYFEEFNECLPEQRNVDFCITLYDPVCGFFGNPLDDNVKTETFSNSCVACKNPEVKFWVEGEC